MDTSDVEAIVSQQLQQCYIISQTRHFTLSRNQKSNTKSNTNFNTQYM